MTTNKKAPRDKLDDSFDIKYIISEAQKQAIKRAQLKGLRPDQLRTVCNRLRTLEKYNAYIPGFLFLDANHKKLGNAIYTLGIILTTSKWDICIWRGNVWELSIYTGFTQRTVSEHIRLMKKHLGVDVIRYSTSIELRLPQWLMPRISKGHMRNYLTAEAILDEQALESPQQETGKVTDQEAKKFRQQMAEFRQGFSMRGR